MSNMKSNQKGIAHLGLLLALVVVAAAAFVAYRVHQSQTVASTTPASTATQVPAKLASKADVTTAANALEATNVDSSVNPDSLNSDINSLL